MVCVKYCNTIMIAKRDTLINSCLPVKDMPAAIAMIV